VANWEKGGEGERDLQLFAAFSLATLAEHEARAVREGGEAAAAGAAASAAAAAAAEEESAASSIRAQAEAEREAAVARERAAAAALVRLEEAMQAAAAAAAVAGGAEEEEGKGVQGVDTDRKEGGKAAVPTLSLSESELGEAAARRRVEADTRGPLCALSTHSLSCYPPAEALEAAAAEAARERELQAVCSCAQSGSCRSPAG